MPVVFLISPCWFRNLRKSLTASDQFFEQTFRALDFRSSTTQSYMLYNFHPLLTKGLLISIQNTVEGAAGITAL
jgi:hypothetical protein